MLNPKELTQKTSEELTKLSADLRGELRDLRFKIATRQHTKVRVLRNVKRDIARVLTAIKSGKSASSRS